MRLALLLVLVGCGKDSSDSAADCSGLAATIGEGEFAYSPRSDGSPITLVHGPQGGWHVDLAGEITGTTGRVRLVPSVVEANQQVQVAGGGQEDEPAWELVGWSARTCSGTFFRLRAFLDDVEDPGGSYQRFICTLEDNAFDVTVQITDEGTGEQVTAGFTGIGALDPDDVPVCSAYKK